MLWRDAVGRCLRRARHDRRETLDEVSARAGVSPQYLSEIERGRKEPSSEVLAAVGGALDLTLLDLTVSVARTLQPARRLRPARPALGSAAPRAITTQAMLALAA
jgi:transcriptional regulator with XRE-family HTH domain